MQRVHARRKPVEAPANQANIKSMIDNLKELKVTEQIEPNASDEIKKTYQLEDAKAGGKIMKMREEDIPEVAEESFRYSGPKPQTKESAIVSLADAVESASRCLEKPTPAKIEQLVNDIIDQRISDHQLDECDLTLRDVRVIAERLRFTLMTMLHSRIAYPKHETKSPTPRDDSVRPDVMVTTRKPETALPVSAA